MVWINKPLEVVVWDDDARGRSFRIALDSEPPVENGESMTITWTEDGRATVEFEIPD